MDKKSISIPFDGFYGSHAEAIIDNTEELFLYNQNDRDYMRQEGYKKEISWDDLKIDYKSIMQEFSKIYVSDFVDYLSDELGINIALEFESLQSPRFYNFETDRIFCLINEADIAKLYNTANKKILEAVIIERHSSRSGFHSFYSNDFEDWKNQSIKEWDCNMLETLLIAAILTARGENKLEAREVVDTNTLLDYDRGFNERISNMIDNHITIKGERS